MTKEGKTVVKLPQMLHISTCVSIACMLIILSIFACCSFRQNIQKQSSSVQSEKESCISNSTKDISVKDLSEKEPSEKDHFVTKIERLEENLSCFRGCICSEGSLNHILMGAPDLDEIPFRPTYSAM